ncbi:MAG: hypothetical protein LBE37_20455, partial [Sphingobacterium sp.]|nr:hypothetical protein [Sphingobacterium sp.]
MSLAPENGKDMLHCSLQTDGYGICFLFGRKKQDATHYDMKLEDFCEEDFNEYLIPCSVDPGRRMVFTAALGNDSSNHEIRRCSQKERTCYTGYKRRQKYVEKLKERKGIKPIETNIPSPKTVS